MTSPPSPTQISNHTAISHPVKSRTTTTSVCNALVDESGCPLDSRYECPMCLNWLDEPMVTTCGHRFCKSCIESWLKKEKQYCPVDCKPLSLEQDIFPDNYTRREIHQIECKCPNSVFGCEYVASPLEVDKHVLECRYRLPSPVKQKCPFVTVKCNFVVADGGPTVQEHIQTNIPHHMNLILEAVQQQSIANWSPPQKVNNGHLASALPPPPAQYANEADENLISSMFQRIVVLEQRCREQDVKIENLTKQIDARERLHASVDPRYSNGVIIWEITQFTRIMNEMKMNINKRYYSQECYTSPHGYKFCARINVHQNEHLSLHVHLMQSENDFHLDWPFNGRLKFYMVHPKDHQRSQQDTIMSKSDFLAFHRPKERISPRGFGFLEYAHISKIQDMGFIENDRLVLKIQVNIV